MATDRNQDQREFLDNTVNKCNMIDGPQATEKPLGFLDLPAEIRNKIYRLAIVTTRPYGNDNLVSSLVPPALTLVNKQIFAEALPIYYAENSFYLLLWAKDEDLSDQDPALFHRFAQMTEYFGRRTTSLTDESHLRYIRNIVVQVRISTHLDPLYYSNLYHTVSDDGGQGDLPMPTYNSLCIRGDQQRMTFTSISETEDGPFDPTKYRCNLKDETGEQWHSFCSVKEAYDLIKLSFTGGTQPIERAIKAEYDSQRMLEEWWAGDESYCPIHPMDAPDFLLKHFDYR
ncbi:hypothetical protein SLS64_009599 [Diaporthe eres]|uniref:Uncharacterized protein n=1 Tax=Diaporthe eres TaxID=83184 RepID=A0ABR1NU65_DIAER